MQELIQAFQFDGQNIRIWEENGNLFAVGRDVAAALGYARPDHAITRHCKGVLKQYIPTAGGIQEMLAIPEGDIYRLIAGSQLPSAERFERWIYDDVLPSLRKTGSYSMPETSDNAIIETIAKNVAGEFGKQFAMVLSDVSHEQKLQRHSVNMLDARMRNMERRQEELDNRTRKNFPVSDQKKMVSVVKHRYSGYACPCCYKRKVLNDAGFKLSDADYDHAFHRGKADCWNGWLVCSDCNQRFRTDRNAQDNERFDAYQSHMRELFGGKVIDFKKPEQSEMF